VRLGVFPLGDSEDGIDGDNDGAKAGEFGLESILGGPTSDWMVERSRGQPYWASETSFR
jgi:hypothetical protein